jgi:hypothetical protein
MVNIVPWHYVVEEQRGRSEKLPAQLSDGTARTSELWSVLAARGRRLAAMVSLKQVPGRTQNGVMRSPGWGISAIDATVLSRCY